MFFSAARSRLIALPVANRAIELFPGLTVLRNGLTGATMRGGQHLDSIARNSEWLAELMV